VLAFSIPLHPFVATPPRVAHQKIKVMSFHLVYNLLLLQFVLGVSLNPPDYSALVRSPYSRGTITAAATTARTKTRTGRAPVPAATNLGASESATAAAATTSHNCCEVCIVAPRAGFALVPRGHRTSRQYTRRRNDDK